MREFALERFYARWEFAVPHNLSASDLEPLGMAELLALADPEARALWDGLTLGYTESAGHPLVRAEIASLYERLGPEDVLTFTGAEEAIYLVMAALVGAGDHVVGVAPAYQSLYELPRARGAQVTLVWLRAEEDWEVDVDAVIGALRPDTRLLVINFPHNPTGTTIGPGELQALGEACAARGTYLLADEVYRGLEPAPTGTLPAAADLHDRCLSLGVLSKTYGLAGLRVGWLACGDRGLVRSIARLKDYTTICGSAPSEVLALIALRARDRLFGRGRDILRRNLALWERFFAEHADVVAWTPPRAGTTAFPRLLHGDAAPFAERLARDEGVLLLPGATFDLPGGHFRIGLGRAGLEPGLTRLSQALRGRGLGGDSS